MKAFEDTTEFVKLEEYEGDRRILHAYKNGEICRSDLAGNKWNCDLIYKFDGDKVNIKSLKYS